MYLQLLPLELSIKYEILFFLLSSLNFVLINDKMYQLSEKHILHMISTIYNLNESGSLTSLVPLLKHCTPESKNISAKFFLHNLLHVFDNPNISLGTHSTRFYDTSAKRLVFSSLLARVGMICEVKIFNA